MLFAIGKDNSAWFYASGVGKAVLFVVCFFAILVSLGGLDALSVSCAITGSGACNGTLVALIENESGGLDNAHSQILDDNITLYMPFDISYSTNTGAVRDFSKYGNNGTKAGNVAWNVTGKYGGAYSFDGTGDWISIPVSGSLNISNGEFTACVWFATTETEEDILGTSSTGSGDYLVMSYLTKFRGHLWTTAGSNIIDSNAVVNTGAWVHGCQVVNSTSITLYVNGTLDNSQLLSGTKLWDTSPQLIIGSRETTSASYNFVGMIDDVIIWNKSLTAGEVSHLYSSQYIYKYGICCTSSDSSLSGSCQAIPFKLSNITNAHIQTGTYSGSAYSVNACISASPGRIQCTYPDSVCPAAYTCLGSMASSESGDSHLTNSHIGNCNEYTKRICCRLNSPPEIQNVILNSTFGTNLTTENLTIYFNESDLDGDEVTNITDFRVNGTSIAILNMPFNTNESSTTTNVIRDYSTRRNNGTLVNGTLWNISGKVGGAYSFDGTNDYILLSSTITPGNLNWTVSTWIKTSSGGSILSNNNGGPVSSNFGVSGGKILYENYNGTWDSHLGSTTVNNGAWHNLLWVNFQNQTMQMYVNGIAEGAAFNSFTTNGGPVNSIGRNWASAFFNGLIDEFQIYNRSLSAEQVKVIYNAGVANLSVQKIHSDETEKGQNWTCLVTGNDYLDGDGVLSNQVIIRNTAPTVTLTAPNDGNATTNRTPMFNWTGFDEDGDSMTYEINLTTFYDAGSTSLCSDVRTETTANTYFIPSGDLLCLKDNGVYYVWSVRANDGAGYGDWSSTRTVNITSLLMVSLPVRNMEFGSMTVLQSNDTTDDAPAPFIVQNDGNSIEHINVSATALWQSVAAPNTYYRYKVDNVTGETNAFNWSGSQTVFANTPVIGQIAIHRLNYSNIKDSAETDIYVQVPPNEPPAIRNSSVTFTAYLGET